MEAKITTVVHFKKSTCDVYIGRPSKWGNPFTHIKDGKTLAKFQVATRQDAIESYRNWITKREGKYLLKDLQELQHQTLGCWCSPLACHGDVLAELVNNLNDK